MDGSGRWDERVGEDQRDCSGLTAAVNDKRDGSLGGTAVMLAAAEWAGPAVDDEQKCAELSGLLRVVWIQEVIETIDAQTVNSSD